MKKLVLFFAVAMVVAFSACQKKAQQETPPEEPVPTEEVAPPVEVVEEAPVDSAAEAAPAETPAE